MYHIKYGLQVSRKRRICYWDKQKNELASEKIQFERHLDFLPECDIVNISSLEDPQLSPCDLLVINILNIPCDKIPPLIRSISTQVKARGNIWTPALLLSRASFDKTMFEIHDFAADNWYFDILNPQHLDSIPIRVANLLKIHDHLHELLRYQSELEKLQEKVVAIEDQLLKRT